MKYDINELTSNKLSICDECGGKLKNYDKVTRTVIIKGGERKNFKIRRCKCSKCGKIYRELPDFVIPYKHYDSEIIRGVIDGHITSDTIGYEDYPCNVTMNRWIRNTYNLEIAYEICF